MTTNRVAPGRDTHPIPVGETESSATPEAPKRSAVLAAPPTPAVSAAAPTARRRSAVVRAELAGRLRGRRRQPRPPDPLEPREPTGLPPTVAALLRWGPPI